MFVVGLPKTGSTTLAELFQRYRSGHEYRFEAMAERLAAGATDAELRSLLLARDAEAALELDAATFHHFYVSTLVDLFPDARFILPIRAPRAWLDSLLAMMVRNRARYAGGQVPDWQVRLGRHMFGAYEPDAFRSEGALRAALPGLADRYLSFWSARTAATLAALPPTRRLLLRTEALSRVLPTLAAFAGVPLETLDGSAHHQNRAPAGGPVTASLDPVWLERRVAEAWGAVPALLKAVGDEGVTDGVP